MATIKIPGREDLAIIMACLALLMSGVSLLISWWVSHRDRGNLKITGVRFTPACGQEAYFEVQLTNTGRRSVFFDVPQLRTQSGAEGGIVYQVNPSLIQLNEGEQTVEEIFLDHILIDEGNVQEVRVQPTVGKVIRRKVPSDVQKQFETFIRQNPRDTDPHINI